MDFYRVGTATFSTSSHYALTWHFDFVSDDLAAGVVNAHAELCFDGKTVRLALRYLDRYSLSSRRWVFQRRTLKFRYVLAFDAVADGLGDPLRVGWPGTQPQRADLPDMLQTYIDSRKAATPTARPPQQLDPEPPPSRRQPCKDYDPYRSTNSTPSCARCSRPTRRVNAKCAR